MAHGLSRGFDGGLEHSWGLMGKALLVMAVGLGALVVSWIAYMVLVAAFILWA